MPPRPRRGSPDDVDPFIKISESEAKSWKKKREDLELTTRELAAKAGTTHGTISNIETRQQRRAKMSLYVSIIRALFRQGAAEAQGAADEALARQHALHKRLARTAMAFDDDELEAWIGVLESRKPK